MLKLTIRINLLVHYTKGTQLLDILVKKLLLKNTKFLSDFQTNI